MGSVIRMSFDCLLRRVAFNTDVMQLRRRDPISRMNNSISPPPHPSTRAAGGGGTLLDCSFDYNDVEENPRLHPN